MNEKRILVILPHPDDEVFPMSGTLSGLVKAGAHITYVCLTLGEMGRNLGNPPFANRVTLPMVRKKELEKSCEVIGIQDLRLWGYHDKTIEFEAYGPLDQRILEVVAEVKPDMMFTYYPGYGVHPDHDACGAAVIRAISTLPADQRPPVYCCAFPDQNLGEPQMVNDVSDCLEQKIGALGAHSSQFANYVAMAKGSKPDPAFLERIKTERFWLYPFQ